MNLAVKLPQFANDEQRCRYGTAKTLRLPFDAVVERLAARLVASGFQIAFRHDLAAQLGELAGTSYPRYLVWGVTHPPSLLRAMAGEPTLGLLLPCHLITYENHRREVVAMAVDAAFFMDVLRHPAAIEAAIEVKELLDGVIEEL